MLTSLNVFIRSCLRVFIFSEFLWFTFYKLRELSEKIKQVKPISVSFKLFLNTKNTLKIFLSNFFQNKIIDCLKHRNSRSCWFLKQKNITKFLLKFEIKWKTFEIFRLYHKIMWTFHHSILYAVLADICTNIFFNKAFRDGNNISFEKQKFELLPTHSGKRFISHTRFKIPFCFYSL